jgi:hypothetical protein
LIGVTRGIEDFRHGKEGIHTAPDTMAKSNTFAEEPFFVDKVCATLNGDEKLVLESRGKGERVRRIS